MLNIWLLFAGQISGPKRFCYNSRSLSSANNLSEREDNFTPYVKNTLRDEGVLLSKSIIKRTLHTYNYRGLTTRCKPLVTLKK